ncbi:hypothetical protein ASG03_10060 [Rhizobium sp. Leaf341]|nr:hypothetical protein ASG03_10060 [Rhizobium sp. Leaf341]
MEAVACLWEAMMEADRHDVASSIHRAFRDWGTVHMRHAAIDLADFVLRVYESMSEEEKFSLGPYDWEFVPAVLRQVDWVDGSAVHLNDPRAVADLILWRPAS